MKDKEIYKENKKNHSSNTLLNRSDSLFLHRVDNLKKSMNKIDRLIHSNCDQLNITDKSKYYKKDTVNL